MNLANYHVGETSLPDVEEIQRLVTSSSRYKKPEEIDEFNRLAQVAISEWRWSVDKYLDDYDSDSRLKHQVSLKLRQPKENVFAVSMLFEPQSLEIVKRDDVYYTNEIARTFTNIGMLTLGEQVGVAFIVAGPDDGYDEGIVVPVTQTHKLTLLSEVIVTT